MGLQINWLQFKMLWAAVSVFPYSFVFLTCIEHTLMLRKLCFSMPLKALRFQGF